MKYKGWNFEKTLLITSTDAIDRKNTLVDAFVTVPAEYSGNIPDDIRVILKKSWNEIDREIPSQIYGLEKKGDVTSFRVVFPLDLGPHACARVGVYYGNPAAQKPLYDTHFECRELGRFGRKMESRSYRIETSPANGQISALTLKTNRKEYTFPKQLLAKEAPWPGLTVLFASEENNKVCAKGVSVADCPAPDSFESIQGPLFSSITRKMTLPLPPGVSRGKAPVVTSTLLLPADEPVLFIEEEVIFPGETGVFGIQGGTLRVNAEKFSHYTFRPVTPTFNETELEEMGHVLVDPAYSKELSPGNVMAGFLPFDLAWHAFIRIYKGSKGNQYAVTSLNLDTQTQGPLYRQACYLFREEGALRAARAPIYVKRTDRKENIVRVPAGSRYRFRNAIALNMWDNEKWAHGVEELGRRLNSPLSIRAVPNIPGRTEPEETPALFRAGSRKNAYRCAGVR